jgi:hypothetical protein
MVGVQLTSREARRLLEAIAAGKLGPIDHPELVVLERKLRVMDQVAVEVEKCPRPGDVSGSMEKSPAAGDSRPVGQRRPNRTRRRQ